MKILIVADHENKFIWEHFDASRFSDIDCIISCGDLKNEYLSFLVTMINKPLFYVHGNHDVAYLKNPPEGCESIEDRIIEFQGVRILGLGGSMLYGGDKTSSAPPFQYTEKAMRKRIQRLRYKLWRNKGFDILVTHSPAEGVCDGKDLCHKGFHCLLDLMERWKPKYLLHGHMHMGFGKGKRCVQNDKTTVFDAYEYYILDYPPKENIPCP